MARGVTRGFALCMAVAVLSGAAGFMAGFVACLHGRASMQESLRKQNLQYPGDAPPEVRSGVIAALEDLQQGYMDRDLARLPGMVQRLFPADEEVLLLGTTGSPLESVHGKQEAENFIAGDWKQWGNLRLHGAESAVWSSGDVAWSVTLGQVEWKNGTRPLRLTAVLKRNGSAWQFRQIQFQWSDSDPEAGDVLRPALYLRLTQKALQRVDGLWR